MFTLKVTPVYRTRRFNVPNAACSFPRLFISSANIYKLVAANLFTHYMHISLSNKIYWHLPHSCPHPNWKHWRFCGYLGYIYLPASPNIYQKDFNELWEQYYVDGVGHNFYYLFEWSAFGSPKQELRGRVVDNSRGLCYIRRQVICCMFFRYCASIVIITPLVRVWRMSYFNKSIFCVHRTNIAYKRSVLMGSGFFSVSQYIYMPAIEKLWGDLVITHHATQPSQNCSNVLFKCQVYTVGNRMAYAQYVQILS